MPGIYPRDDNPVIARLDRQLIKENKMVMFDLARRRRLIEQTMPSTEGPNISTFNSAKGFQLYVTGGGLRVEYSFKSEYDSQDMNITEEPEDDVEYQGTTIRGIDDLVENEDEPQEEPDEEELAKYRAAGKIPFETDEELIRHINLTIRANPYLMNQIHAKAEEVEVETRWGRTRLQNLDSYLLLHQTFDPQAGTIETHSVEAANAAFRERMDRTSKMPDMTGYLMWAREPDEQAKANRFANYVEGHTRMKEVESQTGLKIDYSDPKIRMSEAMKTAELFTPEVFGIVIELTEKLRIPKDYLKSVSIQRENHFEEGTVIGYHAPSQSLYLNIDAVTPEALIGGIIHHEFAHAKIEQEYALEFRTLENEFNFSRWEPGKNPRLESIVESFEEVAAHRTAAALIKDKIYSLPQIYQKYGIDPEDPISIGSFIASANSDSEESSFQNRVYIAEALAVFDLLDSHMSKKLIQEISANTELVYYPKSEILSLRDTFKSAYDLSNSSFKRLREELIKYERRT